MSQGRPGEVLVSAERLQERIDELGRQISEDYRGREVLVVGVLKGAIFFIADLVRRMDVACELDFMAVSSYGSSTHSSGVVRILKDLDHPIAGRHVLVVEDIIDSGLTLSYLLRNLASREPASLEVCSLLTKPNHRRLPMQPKYVGFDLPEVFVVGYGLDHAERFRNLPHIAAFSPGTPDG
ncbi:MAG: hypoxanthine phosphoribosyltransferase [Thermoleophilia bacterium]